MKNIIISSTEKDAGKTTVGLGIALNNDKSLNYFKPFGDRPIYKKKRLIDYDAKLFKNVLDLETEYEKFCIGFDHSKIKYAYDEGTIEDKIQERVTELSEGKDGLIIETGEHWGFGSSISLDPMSLSKMVESEVIIVTTGSSTEIVDKLTTASRYFEKMGVDVRGVVINKVESLEEMEDIVVGEVDDLGLDVLGIIPEIPSLDLTRVSFINDMLFGKVVAGEDGLDRIVENVLVGALSADEMIRNPAFQEERKLIVTGGDRADVVLASLESDTSGIVLTNDIIPPSNIVSKADRRDIPLISVPIDTYEASRRIEDMQTVTTIEDEFKIDKIREELSPKLEIEL
ncbi:MAG: AAA family ATPase [Candidatus Thermoplasmatota archaeon]|nr:AAA family ATPase [Candidatus Thermoplasmatota archaeon]